MNTITLAQLKKKAHEVFSSIIVFCPNFPPLAQTNTAKKFEELTNIVEMVLNKVSEEDPKQWLRVCLQEIQESRNHYENDNRKKGLEIIQRAEEHFNNALTRRQASPRFVVGESGAAQDSNSGFPA